MHTRVTHTYAIRARVCTRSRTCTHSRYPPAIHILEYRFVCQHHHYHRRRVYRSHRRSLLLGRLYAFTSYLRCASMSLRDTNAAAPRAQHTHRLHRVACMPRVPHSRIHATHSPFHSMMHAPNPAFHSSSDSSFLLPSSLPMPQPARHSFRLPLPPQTSLLSSRPHRALLV